MKKTIYIAFKELKQYFVSLNAYIVMAVFFSLSSFFFYNNLIGFSTSVISASQNYQPLKGVNINNMVLQPLYGVMTIVLVLLIPLLTMRLISEEKKLKTIDFLYTVPISKWHIIFGKFFGALICYTVLLLLSFIYPLIASYYGTIALKQLFSVYLGLLLAGTAFISIGLAASSLTKSQIIAAIISFGVLFMLWIIGWAASSTEGNISKLLNHLSLLNHFIDFHKGLVKFSNIIYYLIVIVFGLFLSHKILESEQWR